MIPIGMMIAAYIAFRCFETLCFPLSRYSGRGAQAVAVVGALLTGVFALACVLDLLAAARSGAGAAIP